MAKQSLQGRRLAQLPRRERSQCGTEGGAVASPCASGKSAWELGRDLFGADRARLEASDLSSRVKYLIRAQLRLKFSR